MKRPDTLIEVVQATTANEAFWAPAMAGFLDTFYMAPERRQGMILATPSRR